MNLYEIKIFQILSIKRMLLNVIFCQLIWKFNHTSNFKAFYDILGRIESINCYNCMHLYKIKISKEKTGINGRNHCIIDKTNE